MKNLIPTPNSRLFGKSISTLFTSSLFVVALSLGLVSVEAAASPHADGLVIPHPLSIQRRSDVFALQATTTISVPPDSSPARRVGELLAKKIKRDTGLTLQIVDEANTPGNAIFLVLRRSKQSDAEGYRLSVNARRIVIEAEQPAGLFYGAMTLSQLMPSRSAGESISIQGVLVRDTPRFTWRGLHLDTARHFFRKEWILKLLDEMATLKMNVFHWHLTDDQGWRLESAHFPKLTSVGAWRNSIGFGFSRGESTAFNTRGQYGGFYSRQDIRDVVAYARDRFITVVPGIDIPGHAAAALAAYPNLSCTGEAPTIPTLGGIFDHVLCVGNEETYQFLEKLLAEVVELFPSPWIHLGGEECELGRERKWAHCAKCRQKMTEQGFTDVAQLESYFFQRAAQILRRAGRKLIGWEEILASGVPDDAAIMSWKWGRERPQPDREKAALDRGHDLIIGAFGYTFFNRIQDWLGEPRGIGVNGALTLPEVYQFDPVAKLSQKHSGRVLGIHGALWTELIATEQSAEYMLFPRLLALAETSWSAPTVMHWDNFSSRLMTHYLRMDQHDVAYRFADEIQFHPTPRGDLKLTAVAPETWPIYFTTDGTEPTDRSAPYRKPIRLSQFGLIRARIYHPSGRPGRVYWHGAQLPTGQPEGTLVAETAHSLSHAFDGDPRTFFLSAHPPQAGDHLAFTFTHPQSLRRVFVMTGLPIPKRFDLRSGKLEIATDTSVVTVPLVNGTAAWESSIPQKVRTIRLNIKQAQSYPIAVPVIFYQP